MAVLIEDHLPVVKYNGLNTDKAVSFGSTIGITGNLAVNTDKMTVNATTGATAIKSSAAAALAVGPNGATGPSLVVDASTTSAATGLKITSAASGAGVAVAAVGGTNEALTIDAKGSGGVTINGTGTGSITLGRAVVLSNGIGAVASSGAVSGTTLSGTGIVTAKSATAPAAGGTEMVKMGDATNGPSIYAGTGVPSVAAKKSSVYLRIDATTTNTRLYINTDGDTTWATFTASA